MTTFTEEQIKYLETKINFLDEGDVEQGFNVLGDVEGFVLGSVHGDVRSDVRGLVLGSVQGSVLGDVKGSVGGNVGGDVFGSVQGSVLGDVEGKTPVTAAQAMAQTRENYAETISYLGSPAVDPLDDPRVKAMRRVLEIVADGDSKDYTDNCDLARALPTPTAAELMARINEGEKK